ncbi:MAG TPA: 3-dehydroquinate synthase [Trueperaceae bacterium]|nr:3-dehydroquinate synthase [Trueperaceae bacterium]
MRVSKLPQRRVPVAVGDGYDVIVGSGLLASTADVVEQRDVCIVTDTNVGGIHGPALVAALEHAGKRVTVLTVPAGEASKSLATWGDLIADVARSGLGRDGAVVALGGGVVGDLAGFVAASYLRGVAFYQYPTSLLAMVDASVGGKTGLDLPEGKNLVGAFWQPRAVIADVATLASLPEREFKQGTVELVKHGYLRDPELLTVVGPRWHGSTDAGLLVAAVARSVAVKAAVVEADARESGERAYLNFGHTLAHALEAATGLGLQHGDAVAYGLVFAALLGRGRGHADLVPDLMTLLEWLEPAPLPDVGFDVLAPYIARDKKSAGGTARFVLLTALGEPYLAADVSAQEQKAAFASLKELVA